MQKRRVSEMNKSEAKFHNTALKMDEALIRLLEKKQFSDISVIEICKTAGVNRSTFYAHYENTYDLLEETRNQLINDFFQGFNDVEGIENWQDKNADELIFISPEFLVPYLRFIKKNQTIFKVYNHSGAFSVDSMDRQLIDTVFVPIYAKNGIHDKTVVTYMSKYFLSGISAIITEWVNKGCEEDILFMCEIITICVRPNLKIEHRPFL